MTYIRANDKHIIVYSLFKKEVMEINQIKAINFHYQAAVGVQAIWEFIDREGKEINFSHLAVGKRKMFTKLESKLSNFKYENLTTLFEKGDIEDSLEIWKKNN